MQVIFDALTTVLPASLDEQQFQDPLQRQPLLAALQTLAEQATLLEHHGAATPGPFDFLRQTLATDAQTIAQQYGHGAYREARSRLHQLTERCFACHSQVATRQDSPLGRRFMDAMQHTPLDLKARARLAVATRQFETALTLYEAMFRSLAIPAPDLDRMGAFEDYLKIVLRVRNDRARALTTLDTFRQRPDVPTSLQSDVLSWKDALTALQQRALPANAMAGARMLIQEAQRNTRFPKDRQGLVHFVTASGLLLRYVAAGSLTPTQRAEAYYWLGITESSISRSMWLSETAFFLETAIRLAPSAWPARKAYEVLEESVSTQYTDATGVHLPPDVRAHLDALRRLLDAS
jgi:hypothetical protein